MISTTISRLLNKRLKERKLSLKFSEYAFVSSPSSTNEVNTAYGVSTANTQVSPASTQVSTASTQKKMDLKWQLALLSMRTRRFFQKTGRKITINGSDTARNDKSKVKCFNSPVVLMTGFDWSYMADDEVPINMALISFSDSESRQINREVIFTPKFDLSNSGLEEFQQPEFEGYGPKLVKSLVQSYMRFGIRESPDASLVEELVSNDKLKKKTGHPQKEDQGYVDSGFSRQMTGNMSYLLDFKEYDEGYVTFGGGAKGRKIIGKRTFKTGKLDFEDVYFVKELQFNLFNVSQMCDKKNSVLFTDTGCFVLSSDFKIADESQILLKVPRKNNMYSVDIKNIIPKECLTCLVT
ncbi:hypothetical protein Tco_0053591 [Tanacetum coccineum]